MKASNSTGPQYLDRHSCWSEEGKHSAVDLTDLFGKASLYCLLAHSLILRICLLDWGPVHGKDRLRLVHLILDRGKVSNAVLSS